MSLVGKWQKITTAACSQTYPDTLEFFNQGIYSGQQRDPQADFTWWDAGSYEVVQINQVKISLANDAVRVYEYSISDNTLSFVDAEGCKFQYRRVE